MLKKQQWITAGAGAVLLFSLFIFGKFTPPHEDHAEKPQAPAAGGQTATFNFDQYIS